MNALFLTLFVSFVLLLGMALLFAFLFSNRSHEQSDRLSLLPLQEEQTQRSIDPDSLALIAARNAVSLSVRKLK